MTPQLHLHSFAVLVIVSYRIVYREGQISKISIPLTWSVGMNSNRNKTKITHDVVFQSLPSEIEVKYKIAECYTILKLDKDAIAVLDGIPSRQRTPKVGCYPHNYSNKLYVLFL